MKKNLRVLLSIIIIISFIIGCYKWYRKSKEPQFEVNSTGGRAVYETIDDEPIFSKGNYPKVDASLSIHPLLNNIAVNFLGISEEELDYKYTETGTSDVYKNLIDGKADVILATEPSDADYEYARKKGVELDVKPAAISALVFIVNTANKVDNISLENIVKIYKGEITNWKEINGDDSEIIPYQEPTNNEIQAHMISLVMKDTNLMSAPKMEKSETIDVVDEINNSKSAIGYSYFHNLNNIDTIKILGINGVKPTIETIENGTYPITTNYFVVTLKKIDQDSPTKTWIDEVLSERGSQIIEKTGYVSIY